MAELAAKAAAAAIRAAELYRTLPEASSIRNLSGRASLAFALAFAGWAYAALGRLEEADRFATEAVTVAREASETTVQAWALIAKSLTIAPNDIDARRALLGEALELGRSVRGSLTFGLALIGFGLAEFDAGDFARARAYAHQARDYYRTSGLAEYLTITALSLSALSALAGDDIVGARADAREALTQAHRASRGDLSGVLHVSASIAARNAQPAAAARLLGGSDRLFAELDLIRGMVVDVALDDLAHRIAVRPDARATQQCGEPRRVGSVDRGGPPLELRGVRRRGAPRLASAIRLTSRRAALRVSAAPRADTRRRSTRR